MSILDILLYPHPDLMKLCEPVEKVDESIRSFLDDLAETMYAAEGVGLAAPQVGVLKRVIVVDIGVDGRGTSLVEMINPKIIKKFGEELSSSEGCLSFPELYDDVTRLQQITIEALDRNGKPFTIEAEGFFAVALQHEVDHLNGVLFIDYLSKLKKGMIKRKMRKRYGKGPLLRKLS